MPALTNPKHERFAQELASGKTADESYVTAGYKPNRGNAGVLRHKQYISIRVAEILAGRESIHAQATADAVKSLGLTKQWVIETLMENVARAMQAQAILDDEGNAIGEFSYRGSVANKALELLGKEVGMFIDRKEVGRPGEFESMNADQLREYIAREAPELGARGQTAAFTNGSGKPH
jgi:phage terminase small subunit